MNSFSRKLKVHANRELLLSFIDYKSTQEIINKEIEKLRNKIHTKISALTVFIQVFLTKCYVYVIMSSYSKMCSMDPVEFFCFAPLDSRKVQYGC